MKQAQGLFLAFVGACLLVQSWRAEQLAFENRLLVQAQRIDASQIRELMFIADSANRVNEGEKTRAFLAGFSQAQTAPDLRQIWHEGYDRGTAVAAENARVQDVVKAGE